MFCQKKFITELIILFLIMTIIKTDKMPGTYPNKFTAANIHIRVNYN